MKIFINKHKVKEEMAKKKINSFKELAQCLNISSNQLSNILSNKYDPIKSNIKELAKFLNINPIDLLEATEEENELHRK